VGERVLVTGATGFIGSHLVDELLWKGYEVTALLRRSSDDHWLKGKPVDLLYADLVSQDAPSLDGFTYVFHLAGVTRSSRKRGFIEGNTVSTGKLIAAAGRAEGIQRFVYLSSLAAAGPSSPEGARCEGDACCPVSWYGESKLQAEDVVLGCRTALPVTVLRPAVVYGPRDTYMLEYFKVLSRGLMPCVGRKPVYLSFCYVDDMVSALTLTITREHPSGAVFFISDGEEYTLDFFADVVSSALDRTPRKLRIPAWAAWVCAVVSDTCSVVTKQPSPFHRSKYAEAVQRYWVCDVAKAKKVLGFRLRFGLEAGVRVTLQWYRDHGWL
jgi:nucleoside-diphosphate-sugar epimerase